MRLIETRIIITAIIALLVIISGIILSKKGKTYNVAITTVHKLLSVVLIILCITLILYQHKNMVFKQLDVLLISITGILFLIAVISGGILTIKKPVPNFVTLLHKISSGLSIGFCTYYIYQFY